MFDAVILPESDEVGILPKPPPPIPHHWLRHALSGQVQIQRSHDIQAVTIDEATEGATKSRVDVENLVGDGARIESKTDIHDDLVANGAKQALGLGDEM